MKKNAVSYVQTLILITICTTFIVLSLINIRPIQDEYNNTIQIREGRFVDEYEIDPDPTKYSATYKSNMNRFLKQALLKGQTSASMNLGATYFQEIFDNDHEIHNGRADEVVVVFDLFDKDGNHVDYDPFNKSTILKDGSIIVFEEGK